MTLVFFSLCLNYGNRQSQHSRQENYLVPSCSNFIKFLRYKDLEVVTSWQDALKFHFNFPGSQKLGCLKAFLVCVNFNRFLYQTRNNLKELQIKRDGWYKKYKKCLPQPQLSRLASPVS